MKPVKQLNYHDPDNGVWGDCARAVYASLFDLEIGQVPHFFHKGNPDGDKMITRFVRAYGYERIRMALVVPDLEVWLKQMYELNPVGHFIITGESATGCDHVVIAGEGKIVWDPSRNDSGIVGPCVGEDHYWFEWVVKVL